MAFKPGRDNQPDFSSLRSVLLRSNLNQKDPALFQVINQLIDRVEQFQGLEVKGAEEASNSINLIKLLTYLTTTPETAQLPNSRVLLAGLNISFDDSTPGERTINSNIGNGYWTLLTDGDPIETDFIFANGSPISIFVPV